MGLPNWEDRAEITANLINPAFCSEVVRECVKAYKSEKKENFPFAFSVLILPLILNNKIRERLPKSKANTIHHWLNDNEDLKVGIASKISTFLPFTRETLMFGIAHNSMSIDEFGNIEARPRKGKIKTEDNEVKQCISKAATLGKIL